MTKTSKILLLNIFSACLMLINLSLFEILPGGKFVQGFIRELFGNGMALSIFFVLTWFFLPLLSIVLAIFINSHTEESKNVWNRILIALIIVFFIVPVLFPGILLRGM